MDDLPLNLNVPKPSFVDSHSRSAFIFQATLTMDIPEGANLADDAVDKNNGVDGSNGMDEDAYMANDHSDIYVGKLNMIHSSLPIPFSLALFSRT